MFRNSMRREIKSEINIIPFLDVLLVLVLILIATAPMVTQSVEVDLPDSIDFKIVGNNSNSLVIVEVSGIGQYSMMIDHLRQEQLPPERVVSEANACITVNPKTVFLIGGTKNVPYDEIIKVLNLLHRAGVKSVSLMTRPINS
ncbi:colicin uptake protein TolR [Sodalis endosymbiont of Henestaris halophilus]|uniref:colicin uptake protein TolR n=1 Tax=Sodalis endosymbiont of Henestaris halophilus TaxID=1929246 RepID=UPI000BC01B06|nr:colicin uptake protein TolR [Sodalis endosymbiont of Henestaris halophilus]SNC59104.1 Biopolymer transport protein ExbD [Sodalis endosymbiont of Henestaris halophilus]